MKLLSSFICLLFLLLHIQPLIAQETGIQEPGYIEDGGSGLWEKQIFKDNSGLQGILDSDGNSEYISEEDAVKAIESAVITERKNRKIDFRGAIATERDLKFNNIKYGALTGVMIGGWFAMLANVSHAGSDARSNARYIGVGTVVGIVLGTAIGTKSLYEDELRSENSPLLKRLHQNLPSKPWLQDIRVGGSSQGIAWLSYQLRF